MTIAAGTDAIMVITSLPDHESAMSMAEALVNKRLAACVNVLAACTSVYRWKNTTETAQEVPLLIKTSGGLYPEVEEEIRQAHPYELPEIIAVPIEYGFAGYLEWVAAQTTHYKIGPSDISMGQ